MNLRKVCQTCQGDGIQPGGYSNNDLCESCGGSGIVKEDELVEVVFVRCLNCGAESPVAANGVYMRHDLNYFCPDKDCEDKYAAKQ